MPLRGPGFMARLTIKETQVQQQIPFTEGSYLVEQAFLVTPTHRAVPLSDATIEVFKDLQGVTQMHGKAFVLNIVMVELMEDEDRIDILLDLGPGFRYRLRDPKVRAGKVFQPNTRSMLRFAPHGPLEMLSDTEFDRESALLKFVIP
jgi:hypothetical protein